MAAISILIGGDVCPINRSIPYFHKGDAASVFNDVLEEFERADLSVVNLECPLIDQESPIQKRGPVLGAPSSCIKGIQQAGIGVVNLANNHIMDHGAAGLRSTLSACDASGIATFGAGSNLEVAGRLLVTQLGRRTVGLLGVAEHEFSIATAASWGANPLDVIDFVRNARSRKGQIDYLVVLVHGGNETYPWPSPRLLKVCRFLVEEGANAVICQHSHCPGCVEHYRNGHIVYGQGNLIFDVQGQEPSWYEGFLVKLVIDENLTSKLDTIPYRQWDNDSGARKMAGRDEALFRQALHDRSTVLASESAVAEQWLEFCRRRKHEYLSKLLGHGRLLNRLNSRGRVVSLLYSQEALDTVHNLVRCEAHRDVLLSILREAGDSTRSPDARAAAECF